MALFGSKKEKVTTVDSSTTEKDEVNVTETTTVATLPSNTEAVLLQPRITEKASFRTEGNAYVFEVATDATKQDIKKAIHAIYNVSPEKVNITQIPAKRTFSRGKRGVKSGGKKAYVYLKQGDKIELI